MADEWKSDRQMVTYVLAATNGTRHDRETASDHAASHVRPSAHVDLLWVPGGDPPRSSGE